MAAPELNAALAAGLRGLEPQLARCARNPGVDAVHDARVAARRLRALLRGLERELNPVLAQQVEFELRAIGRTLAPLRDTDVRRASLLPLLRPLLRPGRGRDVRAVAAVAALVADLAAERARERQALRGDLRSVAWKARLERLRSLLSSDALVLPGRDTLQQALAPEIARRWKRLQQAADRDLEPAPRLHRMRIRAKVVRYLLEYSAAANGRSVPPGLDLLRRAQNVLGDLHDLVMLRAWLQGAAIPAAVRAACLERVARHEEALRRRVRKLARELKRTPVPITATA